MIIQTCTVLLMAFHTEADSGVSEFARECRQVEIADPSPAPAEPDPQSTYALPIYVPANNGPTGDACKMAVLEHDIAVAKHEKPKDVPAIPKGCDLG